MLYTSKNNKTHKKNSKRTIKGGKVIGSGGFGCIFKPALKCKNKDRQNNKISKLMKKKYAVKEYSDIKKYKSLLDNIPNYSDYFLIDGFSECDPDTLTNQDVDAFDKKCSALTKMNISAKNVNKNLDLLGTINMPYGGIDVGDYIYHIKFNYTKMIQLNNSLLKLLTNGIIPMNKKHIYHLDIKESNILVEDNLKTNHFYTRLIDWGLSSMYNGEKSVPTPMHKRPFQYNLPFSIVLFNPDFDKMYSVFLKENIDPTFLSIRTFVIKYVLFWINKRGPGHLKTLNSIYKKLFENELDLISDNYKNDLIEFEYTLYFIFEYISKILFKYTKNNKLELMDYFSEVYLKNVDIWGFVMVYVPIVEYLYDDYKNLSKTELSIIDSIKKIILFVLESCTEPIDIDILSKKIGALNEMFSLSKRTRENVKLNVNNTNSSVKSSVKSTSKSNNSILGQGLKLDSSSTSSHYYTVSKSLHIIKNKTSKKSKNNKNNKHK